MSKFKVGDLVECIKKTCQDYEVGGIYRIDRIDDGADCFAIHTKNKTTHVFFAGEDSIKLANDQTMPKLEEGMIVELNNGDMYFAVAPDDRGEGWLKIERYCLGVTPAKLSYKGQVHSEDIYRVLDKKNTEEYIPLCENEVDIREILWKAPEKTEEEIKREKALERINTLEQELAKLKSEV